MTEPRWVGDAAARRINHMLVGRFGGLQAGVRDENLFMAAMARPLNKWHYEEPKSDPFELAAAYCFAVVKGHVFHDGNKRAGYVIAATFLRLNGLRHRAPQPDVVNMMVAVADGSVGEQGLARWFRDTTETISS